MRISRQQMFMDMAEVAARRATCYRGNIGAIIVRDKNLISMGYNGPPAGDDHCRGNECGLTVTGSCGRSKHAEDNAIHHALMTQPHLAGCTIYCTASPCPECAALIYRHNIGRVYYRHPYRITAGIDFLHSRGVEVFKVAMSGMIIRESDRRIMEESEL